MQVRPCIWEMQKIPKPCQTAPYDSAGICLSICASDTSVRHSKRAAPRSGTESPARSPPDGQPFGGGLGFSRLPVSHAMSPAPCGSTSTRHLMLPLGVLKSSQEYPPPPHANRSGDVGVVTVSADAGPPDGVEAVTVTSVVEPEQPTAHTNARQAINADVSCGPARVHILCCDAADISSPQSEWRCWQHRRLFRIQRTVSPSGRAPLRASGAGIARRRGVVIREKASAECGTVGDGRQTFLTSIPSEQAGRRAEGLSFSAAASWRWDPCDGSFSCRRCWRSA